MELDLLGFVNLGELDFLICEMVIGGESVSPTLSTNRTVRNHLLISNK